MEYIAKQQLQVLEKLQLETQSEGKLELVQMEDGLLQTAVSTLFVSRPYALVACSKQQDLLILSSASGGGGYSI